LLRQIGIAPVVAPVDVDESGRPDEPAEDLVRRLAEAKGRRAAVHLPDPTPTIVLAADTMVVVDDQRLGKPGGPDEARAMLRRLRGRAHVVMTGVFLTRTDDGRSLCEAERTRVHFRDYDDAAIEAYLECREGYDKAGAYGIQGRGALLADRVEGSWSNVVGLPLERLPEWFDRIGVDVWSLVRPGPATS
jgi:septum formation protein